ncbi:hypothetical protein L2E82_35441 [Cichorium intybus]|uniref:Uncharacterized protein n=1 Tax=Cichorium intybus TaxID=13427 RepID=A0ACB9BNY1_CICIN|nr:hypothetical protein L2E82_35441 [Cichorium intybus]
MGPKSIRFLVTMTEILEDFGHYVVEKLLTTPIRITMTREGATIDKHVEDYSDLDFEKVEPDERALVTLSMALSPEISQGFREYKSAKALWDALIDVY